VLVQVRGLVPEVVVLVAGLESLQEVSLLVTESRGSLLLVLVSFLGPRWFHGLPASSLV
jgi:hypothetical protein